MDAYGGLNVGMGMEVGAFFGAAAMVASDAHPSPASALSTTASGYAVAPTFVPFAALDQSPSTTSTAAAAVASSPNVANGSPTLGMKTPEFRAFESPLPARAVSTPSGLAVPTFLPFSSMAQAPPMAAPRPSVSVYASSSYSATAPTLSPKMAATSSNMEVAMAAGPCFVPFAATAGNYDGLIHSIKKAHQKRKEKKEAKREAKREAKEARGSTPTQSRTWDCKTPTGGEDCGGSDCDSDREDKKAVQSDDDTAPSVETQMPTTTDAMAEGDPYAIPFLVMKKAGKMVLGKVKTQAKKEIKKKVQKRMQKEADTLKATQVRTWASKMTMVSADAAAATSMRAHAMSNYGGIFDDDCSSSESDSEREVAKGKDQKAVQSDGEASTDTKDVPPLVPQQPQQQKKDGATQVPATIDASALWASLPIVETSMAQGDPYALSLSDIKKAGQALLGKSSSGIFLHAFAPSNGEGRVGLSDDLVAAFQEVANGAYDDTAEVFSVFKNKASYESLEIPETAERRKKATETIGLKNTAHKLVASTVKRSGKRYRMLSPESIKGHVVLHVAKLGAKGKGLAKKSDFFDVSKKVGIYKGQPLQVAYQNLQSGKRDTLVIGNTLQPSNESSWMLQAPLWYVSFPAGDKSGLRFVLFLFEKEGRAPSQALTDMFFVYQANVDMKYGAIELMGSELAFASQLAAVTDGIIVSAMEPGAQKDGFANAIAALNSTIRGPMVDAESDAGRALAMYLGALVACVRGDAVSNNVAMGNVGDALTLDADVVDSADSLRVAAKLSACVADLGIDLAHLELSDEAIMVRAGHAYHHIMGSLRSGIELFRNVELDTAMASAAETRILDLSLKGLAHALGHVLAKNAYHDSFAALWSRPLERERLDELVMDAFYE